MNDIEQEDCMVASERKITNYQELLEEVYDAEVKYQFWKNTYERTEVDLWLCTDWEEVFPNKKPTVKDKEMWIKNELQDAKELRDTFKMNLDDVKRLYELALKYGLEVVQ